ncbi:MAG: hypothetical protein MJ229_06165 [bacterium]|nr:hypothetical protein [bacterium]
MRVSSINNSQQNFNGVNVHKAKRKALYGIAAACALFAATCEITYAKTTNTSGYRSQYRTAATKPFSEKFKNFMLQAGSLLSIGGCLYSIKKADDDREEEKDEKLREKINKIKEEKMYNEIEIITEEEKKLSKSQKNRK